MSFIVSKLNLQNGRVNGLTLFTLDYHTHLPDTETITVPKYSIPSSPSASCAISFGSFEETRFFIGIYRYDKGT